MPLYGLYLEDFKDIRNAFLHLRVIRYKSILNY